MFAFYNMTPQFYSDGSDFCYKNIFILYAFEMYSHFSIFSTVLNSGEINTILYINYRKSVCERFERFARDQNA